jgi:YfiH family protein
MTLPSIPDAFRWTHESWGLALRCRPLESVSPHLFTTRQLPLSSHADWQRAAEALGARQVATLTQVHGRDTVVIRHGQRASGERRGRPQADVLVSNDPDTAIAVRAADCVPLLLGDRRTRAVAAVHAGWRGTASGVAVAAVGTLEREFGVEADELIVAIGPSIGPCCYEVGPELVDAFIAGGHSRDRIDRWFVTPPGASKPHLFTQGANRD